MNWIVRFARGVLSGFCFLVYGFFGLLSFPFVLPLAFWPKAVRWVIRLYYRFFVALMSVVGLIRVRSPEALRSIRGRIVVMNHLSLIDVVILIARLPDATCVVKASTSRNPFLTVPVRTMFLVNDLGPEQTIATARRLLAQGVNLIVFPEGTRTPKNAAWRKLHRGAARIALSTGVPIVPLHLEVDPPVLAKNQPFWDVADRIIRYNITLKDEIHPVGANSHASAVALTEQIGKEIL